MSHSRSDTANIFRQVVEGRHSGRSYNPNKAVPSEALKNLIEAARWAPSSWGEEPWRFIICHRDNSPSPAYTAVFNALMAPNQRWAKDAPVLIVVVTDTQLRQNRQGPNAHAMYDAGAAAQTMMLAAEANGLMLHPMGGIDPEAIARFFKISPEFKVMAVMALGYEDTSLPDPHPRSRQPAETHFFVEEWRE